MNKKQKQAKIKFMQELDNELTKLGRPKNVNWDEATFFFNEGVNPIDAAFKMKQADEKESEVSK